jgi:hypothetical protein
MMDEINSNLVRRRQRGVAALNCRPFETLSLTTASTLLPLSTS